jgi:hypothetical protein
VSDCIKKGIRKVGFTINLDNHNESGSHWVSMFLDLDDKIIFYFDSANNPLARDKDVRGRVRNSASTNGSKLYTKKQAPAPKKHRMRNVFNIFYSDDADGRYRRSKLLTKQQKIDLFVKNRIKDSYMIRNRGTIFNSK